MILTFVLCGLCVSDYKFCSYKPSVIAGASIAAALNGLEYAAIYKYDLFNKLHAITGSKKVSVFFFKTVVLSIVVLRRRRNEICVYM